MKKSIINKQLILSIATASILFCNTSFSLKPKELKIYQNDPVRLEDALKDYKNISKTYVITPVSTDREGRKEGILMVEYKDGKIQRVSIPVSVLKRLDKDTKTIPKDNIKKINVKIGTKYKDIDIKDILQGLPENSQVEINNPEQKIIEGENKISGKLKMENREMPFFIYVKGERPISETFVEKPKFIQVRVNDLFSPEKAFYRLPDKTIVKLNEQVSTSIIGDKRVPATLIFKDGSSKSVYIEFNVVENLDNSSKKDFEKYEPTVKKHLYVGQKEIDLRNILDIPNDFQVKLIRGSNLLREEGIHKARIKISYKDISKERDLLIKTIKTSAQKYRLPFKEISIKENTSVKLEKIDFNLNKGDKVEILEKVDTSISSIQKIKIRISFMDGSSKELIIPVVVE